MATLKSNGCVNSADSNPILSTTLLRSNSSLIFLMSNEFRANRNLQKKPHKACEEPESRQSGRWEAPDAGVDGFLPHPTTHGRSRGCAAAWVFETGPEGPRLVKPV